MIFSLNKINTTDIPNVVVNDTIVERKQFVKFLGILIDELLSWDKHLSMVAKKLTSSIYALRCAKPWLSENATKTLYYAVFQSHINYGLILWGSAAKKHMNKIWILQKKAIRILASTLYNAHTNPLFHKLRILKIWDIYHVQLAQFMFKMYRKELPKPLLERHVINFQIHEHYTRNCNNPRKILIKTSTASKAIYYQATCIWYNINNEMKHIPEYSVFSNKLKTHLLSQYQE